MKSLLGSVLATLLGTAMLVVGIAGVAGAFDGDDGDSGDDSSSAEVTDFGSCSARDPRFADFNTYEVDGPDGHGSVIVTCQKGTLTASFVSNTAAADEPRTLALWLYRSRKDTALIAARQQDAGDGTVVLSGEYPPETARYRKWVLSAEPPGIDEPRRPTDIILQGKL